MTPGLAEALHTTLDKLERHPLSEPLLFYVESNGNITDSTKLSLGFKIMYVHATQEILVLIFTSIVITT